MKRVLLFLGLIISGLSVQAQDNVLQTIEILPVKDSYNIVLVADKAVDVKKTVEAPNKITLNLKDIRASKTINTVYNNVSNVDTVMVEPAGNGVSIFFQAENAAGTSVSFDSLTPKTSAPKASQKIKLNNPIESYAPIYNEEATNSNTSNLFKRLQKASSLDSMEASDLEEGVSDTASKAISGLILVLLGVAAVRLFKRKEPDMQIGLSSSLKDREIAMYKNSQQLEGVYNNVEKPFTTINYGLNAYQRGNANPYENTPVQQQVHNQMNYNNNALNNIANRAVQGAMTRPVATKQAIKSSGLSQMSTKQANIDNIKFLESMTAIYEKSGRHDLAQGLKTSLSKNIAN